MIKKIIFGIFVMMLIASCSQDKIRDSDKAANDGNEEKTAGETMVKYAIIETDKGTIKVEIYADKAPVTAKNFL